MAQEQWEIGGVLVRDEETEVSSSAELRHATPDLLDRLWPNLNLIRVLWKITKRVLWTTEGQKIPTHASPTGPGWTNTCMAAAMDADTRHHTRPPNVGNTAPALALRAKCSEANAPRERLRS